MILLENSISFLYIIYFFFHRFCLIFTDCLFFLILLIRIIYKYSGQEDLRQKRKATVLFPLKQYSSFSLYLFKAFRPKTSLFGEGMWESNPPRTLLTPHTGFEDQETHQLSIYPHILIIPIKLIHYSKLPLTFQVFSYIIFLKKTELHTRLWSGLSTKEEY